MESLEYELVEPIGKRTVYGHQHRTDGQHVWGDFEINDYPDSPAGVALRAERRRLGLHLFEAAHALGLRTSAYGALERGAARCNWPRAYALMAAHAQRIERMARDPRGQVS